MSDQQTTNDFDVFIKDNWPDGLESDCTKLGKNDSDCIQRDEDDPCPSCEKFIQLSKEFEETFRPMSDEEEREANAAVLDAAKRLVIAESLLMQAPVSMEDLEGADLGALLDCAHDTVHRLSQK
jgi:hypothetical protein